MIPDVKVYIATQPADMRKSYDGLAHIVKQEMKHDVLSGSLFVFFNRRCDRVKVLYWDRNGYCLWMKRLEKGLFKLPRVNGKQYAMRAKELNLLLEGVDLMDKQRLTAI